MTTAVKSIGINKRTSLADHSAIGALNVLLFWVFIINVVFLPNDTFNLKIVSLLALLIINLPVIFSVRKKDERIAVIFGSIWTGFVIVMSIILTRKIFSNISMGYPGFIMLLYPTIKKYKINFKKIFLTVLKAMAYFVVFMALLDLLKIVDMYNNPILMWLYSSSNALVGKGSHLPVYYMIFMKTSPLLFVALMDSLQKRKYVSIIVVAAAIFASGTRANILLLAIIIAFYLCFLQRKRTLRYICIIAVGLVVILLILDGRVVNYLIDMFQRKGDSDAVRSGHLLGIFEYWKSSPLNFIIGSGFDSQFYSYGLMEYTANIELSYWNLLRQVGIVAFVLFMLMFLYPVYRMYKRKTAAGLIVAYLIYMAIAYTNPFLYSSTGITLLLYVYWYSFNVRAVKKSRKNNLLDTRSQSTKEGVR